MPLPASLILLIGLRLRATWRRVARSLRTPKGIAFAVGMSTMLVLWLSPAIVAIATGAKPPAIRIELMRQFGPLAILGMLMLSVINSPTERALAFLQAEVDFLFPAPFSRSQLLFYKLAQRVVPLLGVSVLLSIWMRTLGSSWIAVWCGVLLTLWFLHLATLCVALAGQRLQRVRFARTCRFVVLLILMAIVAGAWWVGRSIPEATPLEMLKAFAATPLGTMLALPGLAFARTIGAETLWPEALLWAAAALGINLALLTLAVRLDAPWLEAGAESSRKLAQRLEEFKKTGGMTTSVGRFAGMRLPMPPRWRGVGPLLWRQAITGIRRGARGLVFVGVMLVILSVPLLLGESEGVGWRNAFRPMGGIALFYMSLFLPQILRLDFRGDVDRMDVLKSLPASPRAISLAQVLVPTILVTVAQVPILFLANQSLQWNLALLPFWLPALFFANMLIAALDNAFFLTWPTRPATGVGMQFVSAQVLAQALKMMALGVLVGLAFAAGVLVLLMTPNLPWIQPLVTAGILATESALVLASVAKLFARFDPSMEQVADA